MKARSRFLILFTLLILKSSSIVYAQGEDWDAFVKSTNEFGGSKLVWAFDERYIHAQNPKIVSIDWNDSSYLHHSLQNLNSVETVIITSVEEQPLERIFERLALLPNLKNLVFVGPLSNRDKNPDRNFKIPASISRLQKLQAVKFKLCWKLNVEDAIEKVSALANLKYLLLEFSGLTVLPGNLCKLTRLQGISVENNNINIFPSCFNQLSNLKTLSVTINEKHNVDQIFTILSGLPQLDYLILPYSTFDSSFSGISKLRKLKRLTSTSSTIRDPNTFFHDLGETNTIRHLDISLSRCAFIPPLIGAMNRLETLIIRAIKTSDKDDRLNHLPFEIGKLQNLVSLDASSNHLSGLPVSFSKLSRLHSIFLQENKFSDFPISLTKASGLKNVDLSYNKIDSITGQIKNLKRLEKLQLTRNNLKVLPGEFGALLSLRELNVQRNNLEHLPASFTSLKNLEQLMVNDNELATLPGEISNLSKLKVFQVSNNRIKVLPEGINELSKLEVIDISNNHIVNIEGTLQKLKNLKNFTAGNNNFTLLPDSLGSGYKLELFSVSDIRGEYAMDYVTGKFDSSKKLSRNQLVKLPVKVPYNTQLTGVIIANNPRLDSGEVIKWIQNISAPKARVMASNSNIRYMPDSGWNKFKGDYMDLSGNRIKVLPVGILSMPNIKHLALSNNLLPAQLNTVFESKGELHLAMAEAGLIPSFRLTDELLPAAKQRADFYYYKNDFKKVYDWHQQIEAANKKWADNNILNSQRGEAKYFNGDYPGAIKYLSAALERDTAHNVRIINSIRPSMYYIGQSYLKLKDTVAAYRYLHRLSDRFLNDETSMLSETIILANKLHDTTSAEGFFRKALAGYRKQRPSAGVQLSILELLIMADKPMEALKYADSLDRKTYTAPENFLWEYLKLSASISAGKANPANLNAFIAQHDSADLKMPSWSFTLYEFWLATNRLNPRRSLPINKLHLFATQKLAGSIRKAYVVPFF